MEKSIKIEDTRSNAKFTLDPSEPLKVYVCGPTVYTSSHVGHLKTYMTFDIIRRIFRDYFHLNLRYMMNITNVDDKIIRATYEKEYPDLVKGNYDLNNLQKSEYLDRSKFEEYADYWEQNFFDVMDRVNIEKPDILSRVTEYIPEILEFVEAIDQNGYAFEKDGSVYFYGTKYHRILEEGEGEGETEYSTDPNSKHNFALLKKVRPYEPGWDSKWGKIRPGWHIECSAMASSVFGATVDIHGGGIDLAFPHHTNEVLQSDARFYPNDDHKRENQTWVRHFMHTGHLNIKGLKMSRSLKNFITIDEILEEHTPDQLRMLFLLHSWSAPMDYSDETMRDATFYTEYFQNFAKQVKSIRIRKNAKVFKKYGEHEIEFSKAIVDTGVVIDQALRDNLDTPRVIASLHMLVSKLYQYVETVESDPDEEYLCTQVIDIAYQKIVDTLEMFGLTLFASDSSSGLEDKLVKVVSDIRSDIRDLARDTTTIFRGLSGTSKTEVRKIATGLYGLSDDIRDNKLANLGINLTDK